MTLKKSQRILSAILAVLMVLSLTTVFEFQKAYADEIDGEWKYTVSDGKATITGYIGTARQIKVPSIVNGIYVEKVSGLSVSSAKNKVTSISFENGISEIGISLCNNYTALEIVQLPETITTIGSGAFYGCSSLRAITIPSSVRTIGDGAFQDCTSLYSVSMGESNISVISDNLFLGCTKLSNITLPSNITSIGKNSFSGCTALYTLYIPSTVTKIGDAAFYNCSSLNSITSLPSELKNLGNFAFAGCSSIENIIIPNKTSEIGEKAFQNCTGIKEIFVGNSVSNIKDAAFYGCASLKKIVFGGDYVNLAKCFDNDNAPVIYYNSKYRTNWAKYTETKRSYSAPTSISFTAKSSMTAGTKQTIKITVKPNLSSIGSIYSLSSSNESVATITNDGVITALSGGTTKITATTITGLTKSFTLKVNPKKITSVTATSKTTSSIDLKWTADTSANGYMVYRSTSASSGFKKVGTTYTNSYTDKGLKKGTTYYYKIYSYIKTSSGYLYSPASSVKSAKATSPAPAKITVKKASTTSAKITWTKSIGATGYQVCMATSMNGKYTVIKNVTSSTTLSTTKTGLKKGQTYYFKVRSYVTVNGTKVYSGFSKITKITL